MSLVTRNVVSRSNLLNNTHISHNTFSSFCNINVHILHIYWEQTDPVATVPCSWWFTSTASPSGFSLTSGSSISRRLRFPTLPLRALTLGQQDHSMSRGTDTVLLPAQTQRWGRRDPHPQHSATTSKNQHSLQEIQMSHTVYILSRSKLTYRLTAATLFHLTFLTETHLYDVRDSSRLWPLVQNTLSSSSSWSSDTGFLISTSHAVE